MIALDKPSGKDIHPNKCVVLFDFAQWWESRLAD